MVQAENNKRIAKNTLLLYFRMLLTMVISLFTSRIILNTLGVVDYGIYNVVGGVVTMFTLVSGSLSASVTRFLTFELGKGNMTQLKKIFSTSVQIHIFLAIIIVLLAETVGLWFLNHKMNIPSERLPAANWVLHCSILTFVTNIISVPYNASIIAHERMKAFAYISILEVTLKLIVVLLLLVLLIDKLIIYPIMLLFVSITVRLIYGIYCKRTFEECTVSFTYDKHLIKDMTSFAGWNFIGVSSATLRDQGGDILLNLFHGPVVNAARGVSDQVNTAINSFVYNFMTALNPQITKSYAANDQDYMMTLIYQGARFSFYLLLLLSLPVLIETEQILTIWLKTVPDHTINFVRLILLFAMSESLSGTLVTAMLATGKIRNYQIIVGGLQMMNFPVSYILLKQGMFPEITLIVALFFSVVCLSARLLLLKGMIGISIKYYLKKVLLNVIVVALFAMIIPILLQHAMPTSILRFFIIVIVSLFCTLIAIVFIGCSREERNFIFSKMKLLKSKIKQLIIK